MDHIRGQQRKGKQYGCNIDKRFCKARVEWCWSVGDTPLSDHRVLVFEDKSRERQSNSERNRMDCGKWDINKAK